MVLSAYRAHRSDVGPLATEGGREELIELVSDALAHGARALVGGAKPDGPGWFYPPTVLTDRMSVRWRLRVDVRNSSNSSPTPSPTARELSSAARNRTDPDGSIRLPCSQIGCRSAGD